MSHPVIVAEGLELSYREQQVSLAGVRGLLGFRKPVLRPVLRDIDFVVHKGESLGIIGRNGAGKSTLVKCIAGLLRPSAGSLKVSTYPTVLSVNSTMKKDLTGRQNLRIGLTRVGKNRAEVEALIPQIEAFSELEGHLDRPMSTYSSGMRSRLAFSVAIEQDPDLLLLDEALAVGDRGFKEKCLERINGFVESASAVVMVSHNMNEIRTTCSHVLWLENGTARAFGEAEGLAEEYEDLYSKKKKARDLR